jgi:hypothetical protein
MSRLPATAFAAVERLLHESGFHVRQLKKGTQCSGRLLIEGHVLALPSSAELLIKGRWI